MWLALAGIAVAGIVLALLLWQAKEAQREKDELQRELDDAEAQRREWDIERRARSAVDHIDPSPDGVLNDPHNRDLKKPSV